MVTVPYKGTRVTQLNSKDIAEAYLLRGLIEQAAAGLTCSCREKDSCHHCGRLLLTSWLRQSMATGRRTQQIDSEFHRYIVKASEATMLENIWNLLLFSIHAQGALKLLDVSLTYLAEQHFPVVDALERGDGRTAGGLLRDHAHGIKRLLDGLKNA